MIEKNEKNLGYEMSDEERIAYSKFPELKSNLSFSESIYYEAIRSEVVRCNNYFKKELPLENPTKYHLNLVNKLYEGLDPEDLFGESLVI